MFAFERQKKNNTRWCETFFSVHVKLCLSVNLRIINMLEEYQVCYSNKEDICV